MRRTCYRRARCQGPLLTARASLASARSCCTDAPCCRRNERHCRVASRFACVRFACVRAFCVRACGWGCQWATEAVLRACRTSSSVPLRRLCHCRRRSPRAPAEARLVTEHAADTSMAQCRMARPIGPASDNADYTASCRSVLLFHVRHRATILWADRRGCPPRLARKVQPHLFEVEHRLVPV
jgi:hypothetical protein